jgi:hypothetical protein
MAKFEVVSRHLIQGTQPNYKHVQKNNKIFLYKTLNTQQMMITI